tara:strand:+ start:150 stop:983 length:834 start_codon:yes stop_codon:yes gene_type:complete
VLHFSVDIHIFQTVLRLNLTSGLLGFHRAMDLPAVIESVLIASEDPLSSSEIARLIRNRLAELEDGIADDEQPSAAEAALAGTIKDRSDVDEEAVIEAIHALNRKYDRGKRSFSVTERSKGWKIFTRPEYGGFVRQLFPGLKPRRLSPPAMETLAIIAYRQPVTKASIEHVRGVSSDSILQKLLDRELVKIAGRADLPGRPLLYGTTDFFFEHFGIKSIDELPNSEELRAVEIPEPPSAEESSEGVEDGAPSEGEKQLTLAEPHEENVSSEKGELGS